MQGHKRPLPKYSTSSQTLRVKISKWEFLKLRNFCKAKVTVNKIKRHPTERVKIFPTPDQTKD